MGIGILGFGGDPGDFEEGSPEREYASLRRKRALYILAMLAAVFAAFAAALSLGAIDIPLADTVKVLANTATRGALGAR